MTHAPAIHILAADYDRLDQVAASTRQAGADFLRQELERAHIVSETRDTVQMGSRVRFRDGDRVHDVRLVYPLQSDPAQGRISVLTPVGSALLGLAVGATMPWQDRGGRMKELTVLSVQKAELEALS